jgi:TPR repeat protein
LTLRILKRNFDDVFRYLKLSAESGSPDGQFVVGRVAETGIGGFSPINLDTAIRNHKGCVGHSAAGSNCLGWYLQIGRGIAVDFTVAAETG